MRNSKVKKISQVISDFLNKKKGYDKEILSPKQLWSRVVGKHVLSESRKIYIENNLFYVTIKNPYLKSDLIAQKKTILNRLKDLKNNLSDVIIR